MKRNQRRLHCRVDEQGFLIYRSVDCSIRDYAGLERLRLAEARQHFRREQITEGQFLAYLSQSYCASESPQRWSRKVQQQLIDIEPILTELDHDNKPE